MKTWHDYGIEVPNHPSGAEIQTTCPECSNRRKKSKVKCLSVNVEKSVWICHHCGWRGGLSTGVQEKANPYQWRKQEWVRPIYRATESLPFDVLGWFAKRGIEASALSRNKIGYESVYMPQIEDFVQSLRFPFLVDGQVVNVKSRDFQKNFRLETGCKRVLYGYDDIQDDCTIIVEGEMDKLSLEMAGFQNCVSVPDGAPSENTKDYASKFDFLEGIEERLNKVKKFVLAVDNDSPGKKLEAELTRRLGVERCARVFWPEGCKDANDVLVQHGPSRLKECIEAAEMFPIKGVIEPFELYDKLQTLYIEGLKPGISPGWNNLRKLYTIRTGEVTVITGIPGHGKSQIIESLMTNVSMSDGWRHGIYSPEHSPVELHVSRFIEKYTGKPFQINTSGRLNQQELTEAAIWVDEHYSFIQPEDETRKLDDILRIVEQLVRRKGINGLLIDPWNEIDHQRPSGLTETEYVSHSLTKLRNAAKNLDIHIWLVAHPTKLSKTTNGVYPVPTAYDIAGSANFYNKAHNILSIYRNFSTQDDQGCPKTTDIYVQKIKHGHIGRLGKCSMHFLPTNNRYIESLEPVVYA